MINKSEEIAEQKHSDVGILTLRKDGIITFQPQKGKTEHNVAAMKVEFDIFVDWAKDDLKGFLCDNRNLKKFESDVKVYAQNNLHKFSDKLALIVQSGISSFLTNFFIHLNRPKIPVKTFTDPQKALEWLKEEQ